MLMYGQTDDVKVKGWDYGLKISMHTRFASFFYWEPVAAKCEAILYLWNGTATKLHVI